MYIQTNRTGVSPPKLKIYIVKQNTAALDFGGTAVFFYSTQFLLSPAHISKFHHIFMTSAFALWRVRFFYVAKSLLMTFYRSRSPPSALNF